ncbi:hypothetical protein DWV29_26440 [Enterocloster asparagiformis]|uniref:Uncharacterized protein n=1 Tax=Enterocloster asparagiformis TaxID=333367 RepID=A0A413F7A0_9FIRM|nr:hypothetical protein [Enterocloster asparagiformis]RGX21513.1 hypothetical protein DWV29_26440 [Enterocloster asparagiformis]
MIQKRQMIAAAAGVLLGYGIWAAAQNFGGTADGGAGNTGYGRMADAGGGAGAAGNTGAGASGGLGADGTGGADGSGLAGAGQSASGGMDSSSQSEAPELNEQELAAVQRLAAAVKSGDKERIASELLADGDTLSWLYYETFGEERYRYDGTEFRTDLAGEGMVLTGAASVFYGSFGENGPEGRCTALQAVELEKPRYDYSEGIWKDGRMDGAGVSGYRYYQGPPQGEAEEIRREGRFVRGKMEGTITYRNTGSDGVTATYTMEVKEGVTQPDDRWIQGPEEGVYHLEADDNPAYAYALTEEEMKQPRWVNLLVWDVEE